MNRLNVFVCALLLQGVVSLPQSSNIRPETPIVGVVNNSSNTVEIKDVKSINSNLNATVSKPNDLGKVELKQEEKSMENKFVYALKNNTEQTEIKDTNRGKTWENLKAFVTNMEFRDANNLTGKEPTINVNRILEECNNISSNLNNQSFQMNGEDFNKLMLCNVQRANMHTDIFKKTFIELLSKIENLNCFHQPSHTEELTKLAPIKKRESYHPMRVSDGSFINSGKYEDFEPSTTSKSMMCLYDDCKNTLAGCLRNFFMKFMSIIGDIFSKKGCSDKTSGDLSSNDNGNGRCSYKGYDRLQMDPKFEALLSSHSALLSPNYRTNDSVMEFKNINPRDVRDTVENSSSKLNPDDRKREPVVGSPVDGQKLNPELTLRGSAINYTPGETIVMKAVKSPFENDGVKKVPTKKRAIVSLRNKRETSPARKQLLAELDSSCSQCSRCLEALSEGNKLSSLMGDSPVAKDNVTSGVVSEGLRRTSELLTTGKEYVKSKLEDAKQAGRDGLAMADHAMAASANFVAENLGTIASFFESADKEKN